MIGVSLSVLRWKDVSTNGFSMVNQRLHGRHVPGRVVGGVGDGGGGEIASGENSARM